VHSITEHPVQLFFFLLYKSGTYCFFAASQTDRVTYVGGLGRSAGLQPGDS
jgi:hypothetical protein